MDISDNLLKLVHHVRTAEGVRTFHKSIGMEIGHGTPAKFPGSGVNSAGPNFHIDKFVPDRPSTRPESRAPAPRADRLREYQSASAAAKKAIKDLQDLQMEIHQSGKDSGERGMQNYTDTLSAWKNTSGSSAILKRLLEIERKRRAKNKPKPQ